MKRIMLFIGIAGIISLASCRKNWTCKCVDQDSNTNYHEIPDATLNDADNTCESYEYNNAFGYNNCSLLVAD